MAEHARRCIQELDERGCDYTVLWLAKHYDFLARFSGGEKILNFLEGEMGLSRMQAQDPGFHGEITEEFVRRGVENRHPKRYVSAYYKEELFNLERDAGWPEPYIPFLFQMRPGGFYLFWSWQTAFHWLRYKTIHDNASPFAREGPQLFYECQIVGYPARIILDCDAYLEEFGGRLSMHELQGIVAKIPVYFVTRLGEMGAIKREDVVVVVEKDKSRGGKASRHFVFNIIGIPTGDIKNVLHRVFVAQFQDERAEYNRRRKEFGKDPANTGKCPTAWGHIDVKKGFPPALLTDTSTMHGRNQFSTLFCGKAGEEPPRISRIWRISNHGQDVQVKNGPWAGERHVPDHASAISMLGLACYSSLIPDAVTLRKDFDMPSEVNRDLPAVRIELTITPYGCRQKKNWVLAPMQNHASCLGARPSRRHSCRGGWSQRYRMSLAGNAR